MAYHSKLDEKKQSEIQNALLEHVRSEHDAAYEANLRKAKSKLAKKRCAGRYEGAWWRLMEDWCNDKVTNLHVLDCLKAGFVAGDTQGVIFTPCP